MATLTEMVAEKMGRLLVLGPYQGGVRPTLRDFSQPCTDGCGLVDARIERAGAGDQFKNRGTKVVTFEEPCDGCVFKRGS